MTAGIIISLKKHEKPCQELFEFFTKNHFSLIPSSRTDPKGRIVVNGYKEKSFNQIAERICEAEQKLALVTAELNSNNQRYQGLLDRKRSKNPILSNYA